MLSRLGCGLLSLALALGLAACGGGQTAVPTASPSQQQETPAPAETPEPAVYDDSLITDAYADSGDPATEWGVTYHYEVRVPALLCGCADAAALNAEIMAVYGAEAQRAGVGYGQILRRLGEPLGREPARSGDDRHAAGRRDAPRSLLF